MCDFGWLLVQTSVLFTAKNTDAQIVLASADSDHRNGDVFTGKFKLGQIITWRGRVSEVPTVRMVLYYDESKLYVEGHDSGHIDTLTQRQN